jgi:hypothetical protein
MPSHPAGPAAAALEVACDESGSEGDKLVGGSTDVFAHASVDIEPAVATDAMARVRVEARSPATEVKAGVVLRQQNRRVLEWLLGHEGPFSGRAHVHLTDKALHLTRHLVALGGWGPDDGAVLALELGSAGPRRLGSRGWLALLESFNDLMRAREAAPAGYAARSLVQRLRELGHAVADEVGAAALAIADAVPVEHAALTVLVQRDRAAAPLDPIVPALADVLQRWGSSGRPLWIVHDVQAALTDRAIRAAVAARANGATAALAGIRFVDSQDDVRVQMADFLAGAARRIGSEALAGQGDPSLVDLIAPYVSPRSIWPATGPGWGGVSSP